MSSFQLIGLDHTQFEPLFELTDEQLAELGVQRRMATESPDFPCRVSLKDASEGEELLLLPFVHQPGLSPYQASGPIFVRRRARQSVLDENEVPDYVSRRLMSVRAYDEANTMIEACVCEGHIVHTEIERLLANELVAYIHLHNAKQGCFSCRVNRI